MLFYQHRTDTISLLQPSGNSQTDRAASNYRMCKVSGSCCRAGEAARGLAKRFDTTLRKHFLTMRSSFATWTTDSARLLINIENDLQSQIYICRLPGLMIHHEEESDVFNPDNSPCGKLVELSKSRYQRWATSSLMKPRSF